MATVSEFWNVEAKNETKNRFVGSRSSYTE
ncbi:hypothetical protein SAMN05421752_103223 [Natronorubrum thiooxidans]|uniref:Uncharacterized protein n=1 Tax=Natronorubrum thiooxidans TaxID=308853 RepID=A0A1N7E5P7_9EURY|nr:hypothetical protein SAMN05421752_103223 [Natronorubrum thiooxidans]